MIRDGRGFDLQDLEQLEIDICRLRAAVTSVVAEEEDT
jgi:hypothetical protein